MSRVDRRPLRACLAVAAALLGCGPEPHLAGGSIDIGNSISGVVVDGQGRPVAAARVSLYPDAYRPFPEMERYSPVTVLTDVRGRYRIEPQDTGLHNVDAFHPATGHRALVPGIRVKVKSGAIAAADAVAERPGAIRIGLAGLPADSGAWFYLPGTGAYAVVRPADAAAGAITLDSVAPGLYPRLYLVPAHDYSANLLVSRDVRVTAAETVAVGSVGAARSTYRVAVNTLPSGAGITVPVLGFPLLLRLDSGNFDFSRAGPGGAGLHFTKRDSLTPLPFEIDGWDSAGRRAQVWVGLDTVRGNDTTVFLMHCCRDAGVVLATPQVFDTAAGFTAVWHLGGSGDALPFVAKDATGRGMAASAPDTAQSPRPVAGLIGGALDFDGAADYLEAGNAEQLALGGSFTLSAWVNRDWDAPDSVADVLIGKYSVDGGVQKGYSFYLQSGKLHLGIFGSSGAKLVVSGPMSGTGWKLLTGVFDGTELRTYENGSNQSSIAAENPAEPGSAPLSLGRTATPDFSKTPPYHNLAGLMDEIRCESRARPLEWIRLGWETQRPDTKTVTIR